MAKEESCKHYIPEGKCVIDASNPYCIGRVCEAYVRAELKPRVTPVLLPLCSKDDAMQAIIFLLSEWEIQPQEVVEEYNRLVH